LQCKSIDERSQLGHFQDLPILFQFNSPKRCNTQKLETWTQFPFFQTERDSTSFDTEEAIAIDNYDFEKAQFLREARNELRTTLADDARRDYERELEAYTLRFSEILAAKKAKNETEFEKAQADANTRLRAKIDELSVIHREELRALEARWRAARDQVQQEAAKTVGALLSSSKLLAQIERYDQAISMRDRARATETV
jgi:hypothetical protein